MAPVHLLWLLAIAWACGGRSEDDEGGVNDSCAEQQRLYAEYRAEVIGELGTNACTTDDECVIFEDRTGCSPTCEYAIPRNARRAIDDRLYAYAEQKCDTECPPAPIPPCEPHPPARCVMDRCQ